MRIVLFLDLDDTIFQTAPKCPADEARQPAAYRRDGTPLSFMTRQQRTFLDMWQRSATVIPTTARNLDAFRRVDLPFDHYAILDFGGVVLLPDRTLDPLWDAEVRPRALEAAVELQAIHRTIVRLIERASLGAYARVISDFDMPLYVVVKHPDADCAALRMLRDELLRILNLDRFFVHMNGNNLSVGPTFLDKQHAVKHIIERRLGPEPMVTIGMGDSLSDAAFLEQCDFSVMPRGCQLAGQRFRAGEGS